MLLIAGTVACETSANRTDRLVLATVLADFAARGDTSPYHEDGLVLVRPDIATWTQAQVAFSDPGRTRSKCTVSEELLGGIVSRNSAAGSAAALISRGPRWRLMTSEEDAAMRGFGRVDRAPDGTPVRTVLSVSRPALSADGKRAFVLLGFAWSVHAALAEYVLEESPGDEGGWRIACSELEFFL